MQFAEAGDYKDSPALPPERLGFAKLQKKPLITQRLVFAKKYAQWTTDY